MKAGIKAGACVILFGGFEHPHGSLLVVDSPEHLAQCVLGFCLTVFGGLAIPFHGLGGIPGHSYAALMAKPKCVLSLGVSLFGGLAPPFRRLPVILGRPLTSVIAKGKLVLTVGVSLVGSLAEPI